MQRTVDAAVVERATGALQQPPVELPDQHAVHVAREGHFLRWRCRRVGPSPVCRRSCSAASAPHGGHHVGMEAAGIECFLDGRAIRVADEAQDSATWPMPPVPSRASGARTDAAEGGDGDMNQPRVRRFDLLARVAQSRRCAAARGVRSGGRPAAMRAGRAPTVTVLDAWRPDRAGSARARLRLLRATPARARRRAPSSVDLQQSARNPSPACSTSAFTSQGWRASSSAGMPARAARASAATISQGSASSSSISQNSTASACARARVSRPSAASSRMASTGIRGVTGSASAIASSGSRFGGFDAGNEIRSVRAPPSRPRFRSPRCSESSGGGSPASTTRRGRRADSVRVRQPLPRSRRRSVSRQSLCRGWFTRQASAPGQRRRRMRRASHASQQVRRRATRCARRAAVRVVDAELRREPARGVAACARCWRGRAILATSNSSGRGPRAAVRGAAVRTGSSRAVAPSRRCAGKPPRPGNRGLPASHCSAIARSSAENADSMNCVGARRGTSGEATTAAPAPRPRRRSAPPGSRRRHSRPRGLRIAPPRARRAADPRSRSPTCSR